MYDSESSSDGGWISWFCDLEGHEFFVEVRLNNFNIKPNHFAIGRCRLHQGQFQSIWVKRKNS